MVDDEKTFLGTEVYLSGERVGAAVCNAQFIMPRFEYDPEFIKKGLEVSPIKMPLSDKVYSFPDRENQSLHDLPGLLASSLPDKFGDNLMKAWLMMNGKPPRSLDILEKLCFVGNRGMGALEYRPAMDIGPLESKPLAIDELLHVATSFVDENNQLSSDILKNHKDALVTLIKAGSSVGGARAKALIAFNPTTGEVRSGQTAVPDGVEHWIIKFDGANEKSLGDSVGVGRIEYAYHLMALEAGINMMPCRLLEENGRAHFMTKRFDRLPGNEKIHVQSLWALEHYDHSMSYSYEGVFFTILRLRLDHEHIQEMYRRMVFNILARNQDDHTKNLAFMMNKAGSWKLTPAFDMVWQYSPNGLFSGGHQLSANGKRDNFSIADLEKVADSFGIYKAKEIRNQVADAVAVWPKLAKKAGIKAEIIRYLKSTHRLHIMG